MRFITFLIWSTFLLAAGEIGKAQDTAIYGFATGNNHIAGTKPMQVSVSAKLSVNDKRIEGSSSVGIFIIRVPLNQQMDLSFEHTGYEPEIVTINTITGRFKETHHLDVMLTANAPQSAGLITPAKLLQTLQKNKRAADISGHYEIMQYNLEELRHTYRNDPTLSRQIEDFNIQFKADPALSEQQKTGLNKHADIFRNIISLNYGELPQATLGDVYSVMTDVFLPSDIRGEAIKASLAGLPVFRQTNTLLEFYRSQTSSSDLSLSAPALEGLAKFGTDADKAMVLTVAEDRNKERSLSAIEAIGSAKLSAATDVLARIVNGQEDTVVKFAAIQSLGDLQTNEATMILAGKLQDDKNPAIRYQAVKAILRSKIIPQKAQEILQKAAVNDPSIDVRTVAKGVTKQ